MRKNREKGKCLIPTGFAKIGKTVTRDNNLNRKQSRKKAQGLISEVTEKNPNIVYRRKNIFLSKIKEYKLYAN